LLEFDWSEDLGDGGTIVDSSFSVITVKPATDTSLLLSSEDVLAGSQQARYTVAAGLLDSRYVIENLITVGDSPASVLVAAPSPAPRRMKVKPGSPSADSASDIRLTCVACKTGLRLDALEASVLRRAWRAGPDSLPTMPGD
jgi:hypothetical protein